MVCKVPPPIIIGRPSLFCEERITGRVGFLDLFCARVIENSVGVIGRGPSFCSRSI